MRKLEHFDKLLGLLPDPLRDCANGPRQGTSSLPGTPGASAFRAVHGDAENNILGFANAHTCTISGFFHNYTAVIYLEICSLRVSQKPGRG